MPTLLEQLSRHATERADALAYHTAENVLSWRNLAGGVGSVAHLLRNQLPAGATVILSSANSLQYPVAFMGILAAGCNVFPISPEAGDGELRRAADKAGAQAIIGDSRAIGLIGVSSQFSLSIEQVPLGGSEPVPLRESGDLFLQSSGTTGSPKIVRRSGKSLDAVAGAMAWTIGFVAGDHVLMTVPLTHSYGMEHGLLAPVWAGSCVHLRGLLPAQGLFEQLADGGITIFPGVPSTFEMLLSTADHSAIAPTLRTAYSAGAPLPRQVFDDFFCRFNIRISQLYGASEIGSVTFNLPNDPFEPASVGRAFAGVSVRILDADSQTRQGQIAIAAPSMFSGYLGAPGGLIDGHFPTGDLGYLDQAGRLFVTGRIKLLIDVGGLKVNPLEVESVLQRHPSVESCVVVPIAQSQTIFRLKAIVTPRNPEKGVCIETLRQFARKELASYKIPRVFEIRNALPKSSTGKILRHLLETR